jgi:hypothetical protein
VTKGTKEHRGDLQREGTIFSIFGGMSIREVIFLGFSKASLMRGICVFLK